MIFWTYLSRKRAKMQFQTLKWLLFPEVKVVSGQIHNVNSDPKMKIIIKKLHKILQDQKNSRNTIKIVSCHFGAHLFRKKWALKMATISSRARYFEVKFMDKMPFNPYTYQISSRITKIDSEKVQKCKFRP